MKDGLKKLSGESLVYGIGQVSGRAVQVLLVPILTRALVPGEYAISELAMAYSQTALLLLVMGMDGSLARFFYHEPDRAARVRMVSSSLAFRLVTGVGVALLAALAARPLASALMGGVAYEKYLRVAAVTLPFTLLVMFGNDVLRVTFQPWKFITLNLANTVLVTGCSLFFVLHEHRGVIGVLYGRLLGDVACTLLALVLTRHSLRPAFDGTALRRMLSYGLPTVPAAIAYGLITSLDRFMLQRTRSLEEVAVYGIAVKFFAVVTMGVSAFQLAYGPFAYARAREPGAPRLFARVFASYVGVAAFGALVVGLLAPEILRALVPASYAGAAGPALWLAFAAVAQGAYTVASVGIGLALATPLLGWCAGGAALIGAFAQWQLTPRWGPVGAGAATFCGYLASAVFTYFMAQRVHPLPYRGGRLAALGGAALVLGLVGQRFGAGPGGLVLRLVLMGVFATAVALLRVWRGGFAVDAKREARAEARGDGAPAPGDAAGGAA
jgi:O-antigen/teichoic acid export membrane protein